MDIFLSLFVLYVGATSCGAIGEGDYDPRYGSRVGRFLMLLHDISGDVYAVDNTTIYIKGFQYDGEAPDAYFFAGNKGATPSHRGFIIPDEKGRSYPLGPYRNRNLVLKFPVTKKGQRSFSDIKWISVWCKKFGIDFGYVQIPKGLKLPHAFSAGPLETDQTFVKASDVIMEDTETIKIKDFTYDASVPDAIFVMGGNKKNSESFQILNEKGSKSPLSRYNGKNLTLKMPKSSKGTHIHYFGIWSPTKGMIASAVFPESMRVPPSLNSL